MRLGRPPLSTQGGERRQNVRQTCSPLYPQPHLCETAPLFPPLPSAVVTGATWKPVSTGMTVIRTSRSLQGHWRYTRGPLAASSLPVCARKCTAGTLVVHTLGGSMPKIRPHNRLDRRPNPGRFRHCARWKAVLSRRAGWGAGESRERSTPAGENTCGEPPPAGCGRKPR